MVHSLMPIWAEEPDVWARIEEQQLPTYEAALNAAVERSFFLRWAYPDGTANDWQIVVTASSPAR